MRRRLANDYSSAILEEFVRTLRQYDEVKIKLSHLKVYKQLHQNKPDYWTLQIPYKV